MELPARDGGGITLDMFCHWYYVLENIFGPAEAVTARVVTHIPERVDENGRAYEATADDAAYGIFELVGGVVAQINSSWCVRVNRDELADFQVDGPALAGYWGSSDISMVTESLLTLIRDNAARVEGVKVSLLDADHEVRLRAALPPGVRLYTGDDFNYPSFIESGSDALLGIFDTIAPAASAALQALDENDVGRYRALLAPTVPLSRKIFEAPTYNYKTGIVFLAWLAGHQDGFTMIGGDSRPVQCFTSPRCSAWPTGPGCSRTPNSPSPACARCRPPPGSIDGRAGPCHALFGKAGRMSGVEPDRGGDLQRRRVGRGRPRGDRHALRRYITEVL